MKNRLKLIQILNPPPCGTSVSATDDLATTCRKAKAMALRKTHPFSSSTTNNNGSFKIQLVTLHPSQPLVAYFVESTGDTALNTPSTTTAQTCGRGILESSSIVVQQVQTRQVLCSMNMGEIAYQLLLLSQSSSKTTKDTTSAADLYLTKAGETRLLRCVKEQLGKVQRIQFMDPSTLYWSGGYTATSLAEEEGDESMSSTNSFSYLMVQFASRILILSLRQNVAGVFCVSNTPDSSSSTVCSPIVASITADSLSGGISSSMSSNAVCLDKHTLMIAMSNGTIKIYDWKAKKVLQSLPTTTAWANMAKSDYIVESLLINPYGFHPAEQYDTIKRSRSVVFLTKKGGAFICPLTHTINSRDAKESATGWTVETPLARLEGGSAPTDMSSSKQDDDNSGSMEHKACAYDAFRDLFLWLVPSKSKSKLLVWDLTNIMPIGNDKKKQYTTVDKPDPMLVMQFPFENVSHMIFPAWYHEATPKESMSCVVVTKEGDLQVLLAPLYNSGSTLKHPYMAYPIFGCNLIRLVQRDLDLPDDRLPCFKAQSIQCPPLRDSSSFVVATTIGVIVVKMLDGNVISFPGTQHAHFSANFGTMGRAVLFVKGPQVLYSPLEPEGGLLEVNPIGKMEYGSTIKATVVYESPAPLHLPPEIHKRPVRLPPRFLTSPSRNYVCCFWKEEMRYEIISIFGMMEKVTNRTPISLAINNTPVVTSGNGVASFAWVGDDDVFCLLYDPEQDLALKMGIDLSTGGESGLSDLSKTKELKMLKELARLRTYKQGMKSMVGTAGKLKSLEGLKDLGKDTSKIGLGAVKGVKKLSIGTVKFTGKMALGTTAAAQQTAGKVGAGATKTMTKMAVGSKKGAKKLAFGWGKKKGHDRKHAQGSLATADTEEEDEEGPVRGDAPVVSFEDGEAETDDQGSEFLEKKYPWVEMRILVGADGVANGAAASNLGQLSLRSGNRNPPTVLFGGPVLCVGSKHDESDEGLAYFYTKKKGQDDESTSVYVSSGPAFPCPDFVTWDDDGILCAVVIQDRVSIYLSDEPKFIMLGTARLRSCPTAGVEVCSCRFIHGVLYCTTRCSVQCVFLGDLQGKVCHLDSFVLASSDVSLPPSKSIVTEYRSLFPPTIPMPLVHPEVLGYQNGSLILSSATGILALPLGFPLIRIGTLLAAGTEHHRKAEKWLEAIPNSDHEALASFLERRGVPEMSLSLPGISLEKVVDICMRYGYVDRLEEVVEMYGLAGLRGIDTTRVPPSGLFDQNGTGANTTVNVGAYLLGHGRIELVRRLATECLGLGEEGQREAFMLASLLLSVRGNDAKRVIQRSVENLDEDSEWLVGSFVKYHVL